MSDHARARPVTSTRHEAELGVDVRRVVAYLARCGCGWSGPYRRRHHEARTDAREHNERHRSAADCGATPPSVEEAPTFAAANGWPVEHEQAAARSDVTRRWGW